MGGLIAIVILTSRTVAPIGQAAALISNYSDAKTAYTTINEIISRDVERPAGKEFVERPKFKGKIEFKNVSFNYPGTEVPALSNVSFVIEPGEKVALIGRIGSGKSTIAKLILKLYEPIEGKILIDDIDIIQIDPADLRRFVSYVPQDVHLFKGTIKENIVSSEQYPDASDIIYAAQVSGVEEFVKTHPLGYDMPIGERGAGLSGGQRQSVGIARALMQDSSIMIMDEPSNAMDQTTEKRLLDRLKDELKDQTVIIITQKMALLEMVERVIVMHNSKVLLNDKKELVVKQLSGASNV
jgi:ATP-binding cassette subfamily C protein LapB